MSLDDDEVYAMSHNVLLEVQNSIGHSGEDAVFKLVDLWSKLQSMQRGLPIHWWKTLVAINGNQQGLFG